METRKQLVEVVARRYRAASREEKTRILDEFVAITGYHQKYAISVVV